MRARLHIDAIGFAAPGLETAAALFAHLDGAPRAAPEGWTPAPASLPRRQALRLSPAIRLAILAAEQVGPALPTGAAWVFGSSVGEGETLDTILTALCQPEPMIQPIRFQNAVHNAAQGQWSIAARATGPATSLAAWDDTAGAALLKAAMQATLEEIDVGVVVFDAPIPGALHAKRPIALPMAAAVALSTRPGPGSLCRLDIEVVPGAAPTDPAGAGSVALAASGNPVRFLLPLMARMHRADPTPVVLGLPGAAGLRVTVGEVADVE